MRIACRILVRGDAAGVVLVLDEPISFWGGIDPATGSVIDPHHPQRGAGLAGRIAIMPSGRGSSSSASVFAETIRAGTAPAAVVLGEADPILALGAIAARELYGRVVPVVVVSPDGYRRVCAAGTLRVAGGTVDLDPRA